MKTKLLFFLFFVLSLSACSSDAQLNVRNFTTKNDMDINAEQDEDIEWYQAEQVQYDIFVRRGIKRVNIPTNAVPIWRVWLAADVSTLYVLNTGTVVSATAGHVRFTLTPSESNLATNSLYLSAADVSIGTTNIGTIANSSAIVRYSPQSTNVAYSGTVASSSPFYVVAGDTLEGTMDADNNVITNAVYYGDGSGLTGIVTTDTRLDNTTATNAVNMGDFDIDAAGNIAVGLGDKITIGSPTNTFTAFPLHVQATGFDIDSSHIDPGLGASTAGILASGVDAVLQLMSKDEGGHGSTILQSEYDASGNFVQSWVQGVGATTISGGSFYIDHTYSNDYGFTASSTRAPLFITTNNVVNIGGGTADNYGLNVRGSLRVRSESQDTADSGAVLLGNQRLIAWESSPAGTAEPAIFMDAQENFKLTNVNAITLPFGTSPGINDTGEFALDTGHGNMDSFLTYYDGTEAFAVIAVPITDLDGTDDYSPKYNAATDIFRLEADVDNLADPVFVGTVAIGDGTTASGILQIDEDDDAGSNFASFQVPALAANTVYTLPPDDGDASEVLQTDGAGVMTWVANTGGDSVSIDGVGVVDPDFVSTGDIDFIDTSNTITADINSGADYTSDNVTISNLNVQTSLLGISIFTLSVSQLVANVIDTVGAADMDYGSADVTDHTFTSDGGTVILDGTIDPSGAILLDATAGMSDGANSFFDFGGTAAGGDLSVSLGDNDIAGSGLQIEILATSEAIELKNTAQTAQVSVWGDLDADIITADEVVNIENADTTIARSSAGVIMVEGNVIHHTGGADINDADITDSLTLNGSSVIDVDAVTGDTVNDDDLDVAAGGTGVSTLTDGGVLLGAGAGDITALAVTTDGAMIVGDGTTAPVAESGATLRTSIGVGTGDSPTFTAVIASGVTSQLPIFTQSHATSHTLTDTECYGSVYYVTAASVTLTLPAIADGMNLTVVSHTANAVIVDVNALDLMWLDGVALTDGQAATSPGAVGDMIVFTYLGATGWSAQSNGWAGP